TAHARKSRHKVSEIHKRILFSGAFKPESIVAAVAIGIGLAAIVSRIFPDDARPGRSIPSTSAQTQSQATDPFNPYRYPDFLSTQRRERCFQEYLFGGMTPQGRDLFLHSVRTFTKCVYY
ncbi:MAG: hypothetical protein ACREMA_16000, partial [Longimicrobiales bacterium]